MPYLQLTGAPGFLALVLLLACLGAVGQVRVEESLERLEVKCRKGDERACEKVERIRDERVQLDSLEKQAVVAEFSGGSYPAFLRIAKLCALLIATTVTVSGTTSSAMARIENTGT